MHPLFALVIYDGNCRKFNKIYICLSNQAGKNVSYSPRKYGILLPADFILTCFSSMAPVACYPKSRMVVEEVFLFLFEPILMIILLMISRSSSQSSIYSYLSASIDLLFDEWTECNCDGGNWWIISTSRSYFFCNWWLRSTKSASSFLVNDGSSKRSNLQPESFLEIKQKHTHRKNVAGIIKYDVKCRESFITNLSWLDVWLSSAAN